MINEMSDDKHQILKKPRIMAKVYNRYLPKAELSMTKEAFLNEIINLAAFTDKFAFIQRTKPWGMSDETEVFEGLVMTYLHDPWANSALGRIMDKKDDDDAYQVGRYQGHYNLPMIDDDDYNKLIELIGDPDFEGDPDELSLASTLDINPSAAEETMPIKMDENKIKVRFQR